MLLTNIIQKTRDDYNKIAKHFSGTRYDTWPELEQFKPIIKAGQCVLDWGCGNGRLILMLRAKNIRYFGLDQSQALLKIARKKHAADITKGVAKFFCTAHKDKKFLADFFDVVFMIASLHHLPDTKSRRRLLQKIYQEMKPGAALIITVWNLKSDWSKKQFKKNWKKITDNDYLVPWKNSEGKIEVERYYHHFSPEELHDLLRYAGFTIERLEYYNGTKWSDKKNGRNLVAVARKSVSSTV